MHALQKKAIRLELKELDEATGDFTGYASVFDVEDQGQDIVAKGAFAKSLKVRGPDQVKMLYEHDPSQPVGKWLELTEDDHGLLAKGRLLIGDLAKAREVHALMKNNVLDGLSIGFRCIESSMTKDHVRVLEEIDLREISAVLFPMNEEAVIASVKSGSDLPTEREFERLLTQDAGQLGCFTRSEVRQFLLPAYRSLLKAKQDAGGEVASSPPNAAVLSFLTEQLQRLNS
jgi:uncharacterized protein